MTHVTCNECNKDFRTNSLFFDHWIAEHKMKCCKFKSQTLLKLHCCLWHSHDIGKVSWDINFL